MRRFFRRLCLLFFLLVPLFLAAVWVLSYHGARYALWRSLIVTDPAGKDVTSLNQPPAAWQKSPGTKIRTRMFCAYACRGGLCFVWERQECLIVERGDPALPWVASFITMQEYRMRSDPLGF